MVLEFEVLGPIVPNERARSGKRGHYTPEKTRGYRWAIAWAAKEALGKLSKIERDALIGAPGYTMCVRAHMQDRRTRDLDNIVKTVKDALNQIVWRDDSLVSVLVASKYLGTENPRLSIYVETHALPWYDK